MPVNILLSKIEKTVCFFRFQPSALTIQLLSLNADC